MKLYTISPPHRGRWTIARIVQLQPTMTSTSPHYLLFSEASREKQSVQSWRFVLQNVDTQRRFSATDTEPAGCGERLELLAVVRGLEALDGPARITLITRSRYVSRGIKSGLAEWRANGWSWERFGRIVPIRDHDLWRRVDRALRFHELDCQSWQFEDAPAEQHESPAAVPHIRRRVRSVRPLPVARVASGATASRSTGGLINQVRTKLHGAGHLPGALRAIAEPLRHAFGATA